MQNKVSLNVQEKWAQTQWITNIIFINEKPDFDIFFQKNQSFSIFFFLHFLTKQNNKSF